MSTSYSRSYSSTISANPISYEMTSGCIRVSLPNNLTCAILLIASGITNAAPRLETIETLHLKNNGARQITSANSQWLPMRNLAIVELPYDSGKSTNAEAIAELRLLTGFTWDQVARLFSVSRRSVHLWASGEMMSSDNEEHLHRMLGVIGKANRGHAAGNRAALLSSAPDSNLCVFDMLIAGDYEGASRALGVSMDSSAATGRQFAPSSTELSERAPPSPDVLLVARQDDRPLNPRRARAVNYRRSARDV
jgi:transcriptional regulator with XRE-family HTH domain